MKSIFLIHFEWRVTFSKRFWNWQEMNSFIYYKSYYSASISIITDNTLKKLFQKSFTNHYIYISWVSVTNFAEYMWWITWSLTRMWYFLSKKGWQITDIILKGVMNKPLHFLNILINDYVINNTAKIYFDQLNRTAEI